MRVLLLIAALAAMGTAQAQEYWHFGSPMRMYGVYQRRFAGPNVLNSSGNGEQYSSAATMFNLNSRNSYYEQAVANISIVVESVTFDGLSCKKYVSDYDDLPLREDDLRKMSSAQRLEAVLNLTHRRMETVIDPAGNPRLVYSDHRDGRGRVQVWAKFEKDEVVITVTNKQGTKKLNIVPAFGIEAFRNPIPMLLSSNEKDREIHRMSTIDPKTGGVINYTVQYKTKFKGKIDRTEYAGYVYELSGPNGKRFLLVSEKGELVQVDYGNDRDFINAVITTDLSKPIPPKSG